MKITSFTEKLGYLNKSSREKQQMITIGEAYSLWTLLVLRYDALITSKTLLEFAKDSDLKKIVHHGIEVLEDQKNTLENLMKEFSISMPNKPPEHANIAIDINAITDQFIYRDIYNGMSNAMFKHLSCFQRAQSSYLRDFFRKVLNEELDLYDSFYEYGKQKAYLLDTPSFRP